MTSRLRLPREDPLIGLELVNPPCADRVKLPNLLRRQVIRRKLFPLVVNPRAFEICPRIRVRTLQKAQLAMQPPIVGLGLALQIKAALIGTALFVEGLQIALRVRPPSFPLSGSDGRAQIPA